MTQPLTIARNAHVALRRFRARDLDAFQSYRNDPSVAAFQAWRAMDTAGAKAFLSDMSAAPLPCIGGWYQIAIADASSDQLLGDIGVYVTVEQTEAELGISLARAEQGNGYGCAAVDLVVDWLFRETQIAKIVAITDARNLRAQTLLERLGWPRVGSLGPEVEIVGLMEYVYECHRLTSN